MTADPVDDGVAGGGADLRLATDAVLAETGLLDADEDVSLHAVAELAAWICGTPMAAVSLVEGARQFFAGAVGLPVRETPRSSSFCAVAMQTPDEPMLVPDAQADPRFVDNPLVLGAPDVRSYAGVPLLAAEGLPLGAVCALGSTRMDLTHEQVEALRALGEVTSALLQSHRTSTRLQVAVDTAEQARAAEQVSREQFATLFEHAPLGMTVVDQDGVYLHSNAAFAAMVGWDASNLVGTGSWELTVAQDAEQDRAAAERMLSIGGGVWRREKHYVRPDGSTVPALVTTSLIRQADGQALLLNQIESVEQRRAAESRLLELQSVHDGLVSIDAFGRVTSWNLGAQRLFGHSADQMLGQQLDAIVAPELLTRHNDGIERLRAGGVPRLVDNTVEVPAVRADGLRLMVELSLSSWSQDDRTGYTAVLRDVTARRRAELLADLVRHAASTANAAESFATGAQDILREVCNRLGWVAAHAWTADDPYAVWSVAEHEHAGDVDCPLRPLAESGHAPGPDLVPFDTRTRFAAGADELPDPAFAPCLPACGIGSAIAVPVLAGGDVVAMLAGYLPHGADAPEPELTSTLEQIGSLLGRVVERERAEAQLRHQADHDPLTELANRRRLLREIASEQTACELGRAPGRTAVALIDLDRFAAINASYGHPVGDIVLREAADRLRAAVRPGDLVSRLGGDEFVVVLRGLPPATPEEDDPACATARRLLLGLAGPVDVAGQQVPLEGSVGVCVIGAAHAGSAHYPASVLRDADAALRHAKRHGRGQVALFDAAMRKDTEQRLADESDLAAAISTDGLAVYYQPLVGLSTGTAVGVEALVRWPRPGHGMVPPDAFIPLAEDTGLIVELGRWVLQRACADAAGWARTIPSLATASVSVNVSTRQLAHPRFVQDVRAALATSRLDAERLVLEITESALIEDRAALVEMLGALRALGVRIALDDFGTGYSSLSYVQDLPVDILKIDKSFIDPITGPGAGTALAEVVLKLAEAVGLRTVAEGIESPAQAEALRLLGCHTGQGYTWSRPLPLDQLAVLLASPGFVVPAMSAH